MTESLFATVECELLQRTPFESREQAPGPAASPLRRPAPGLPLVTLQPLQPLFPLPPS